jgi:tripartite-type tricarboxylate transporter receptor subunit TctC
VVVDNRASASGVIAGELTANAPPDGYTLLLAYHQHTVNAALNPKLPYHPVNSFTPITQLTTAGLMLVVNPATPVKNLAAGLPRPIVTRLHDEFVQVLNRPDIRERIVADGSEPAGTTPEEFRRFMLADLAKWAKLVKESGAKLD